MESLELAQNICFERQKELVELAFCSVSRLTVDAGIAWMVHGKKLS